MIDFKFLEIFFYFVFVIAFVFNFLNFTINNYKCNINFLI